VNIFRAPHCIREGCDVGEAVIAAGLQPGPLSRARDCGRAEAIAVGLLRAAPLMFGVKLDALE
jgi:hypothetical protein